MRRKPNPWSGFCPSKTLLSCPTWFITKFMELGSLSHERLSPTTHCGHVGSWSWVSKPWKALLNGRWSNCPTIRTGPTSSHDMENNRAFPAARVLPFPLHLETSLHAGRRKACFQTGRVLNHSILWALHPSRKCSFLSPFAGWFLPWFFFWGGRTGRGVLDTLALTRPPEAVQ